MWGQSQRLMRFALDAAGVRILGRFDAVFQGLHVGLGLHNQRADPSRTAAVDEGASLLFRYANDDVAVVRNAFDRLAAGTGAMAAAA